MLTYDELSEMSDEALQVVIDGCKAMEESKRLPLDERILFAEYMSIYFGRLARTLRDAKGEDDA